MQKLRIVGAWAGLLALGCGGSEETCTTTEAFGAEGLYSSSNCPEEPTPPADAAAMTAVVETTEAPDADTCTETFALSCTEAGCSDDHSIVCPPGVVVDKTVVAGCRKISREFVYSPRRGASPEAFAYDQTFSITGFAGQIHRQRVVNPWRAALDRFNVVLNDGGTPAVNFRTTLLNTHAAPAVEETPNDIREFRIHNSQTLKEFPTAAASATCSRSSRLGRHGCIVQIYMKNIRASYNATGFSMQDYANAAALHELGHVACLDHITINSNQPHVDDSYTAMNNFLLTDTVNGPLAYNVFTTQENADIRTAIASGQRPDTFSAGFNVDSTTH